MRKILLTLFLLSYGLLTCLAQEIKINTGVLKKSKGYYSTSGLLSKKDSKLFAKQSGIKQFFGRYYFIEKKNPGLINAYVLTVQDTIKPWLFDNTSEAFVELTCLKGELNIISNIGINTDVSVLNKTLGKPIKVYKDFYIYKSAKYYLSFSIKNAKVDKYRVGIYSSKELSSELIQHLTSF